MHAITHVVEVRRNEAVRFCRHLCNELHEGRQRNAICMEMPLHGERARIAMVEKEAERRHEGATQAMVAPTEVHATRLRIELADIAKSEVRRQEVVVDLRGGAGDGNPLP